MGNNFTIEAEEEKILNRILDQRNRLEEGSSSFNLFKTHDLDFDVENSDFIKKALQKNKIKKLVILNDILVDSYKRVSDGFRENTSLQELVLKNVKKKESSIHLLVDGIFKLQNLQTLTFEYNNFDTKCCTCLSNILRNNQTLRELNINGMDVYSNLSENDYQYLFEGLCENQSLRVLKCESNNLKPSSCAHLSKVISKHPNLLELYLSNNSIDGEGFKHISEGLYDNKTIKKLILSGNGDVETANDIFLDILRENDTLEELDLYQCGLFNCNQIFNSLRENEALKILNIGFNRFGEKSLKALFKLIILNSTLEFIDIKRSVREWGIEDEYDLKRAMKLNCTVTVFVDGVRDQEIYSIYKYRNDCRNRRKFFPFVNNFKNDGVCSDIKFNFKCSKEI
eukprot:gene9087-1182_t